MTAETQYNSGDDVVVEFLDYRYSFSRTDFTQRVVAAAVRLELVPQRDVTAEEAADLARWPPTASFGQAMQPARPSTCDGGRRRWNRCIPSRWCTGCESSCSGGRGWIIGSRPGCWT